MGRLHPPLRPFSAVDVWAWTAEESSAFDARAIEAVGVPQTVLMENAGRAAALVLARVFPDGPVVAVVGAGNNGGDALVAVRTLRAWGRDARAVLVAERPTEDPLLHGWPVEVTTDADGADVERVLRHASVIVDGVLGTGVRGAPRARQAEAIMRVNASGCPVLAVDVPSGIDATSGATPGAAVRAAVTVSFGAPKLGALLHPARALVGRHVVVDIGFPPIAPTSARVIGPAWARARLPRRESDTHKNRVGRVCVVAGKVGMAGAAVLAGRGAFRAGAGFVRVCSVPENREAVQAALPEALFVDATDAGALDDALSASDAVAAGPGLGTGAASREILERALTGPPVPTVLDADALNLAAAGALEGGLEAVARSRPLLLTPHPGEMARLLPDEHLDGLGRVATVRAAVDRFGCAVLLKGAPSLVGAPHAAVAIDTQSSSDLAVAGIGDVLTGVCGSLLAQGVSTVDAGVVGLYLTGRAARLAGRGAGLIPTDVARWLPDARTEPGAAVSDLGLPFVTFDADPPA